MVDTSAFAFANRGTISVGGATLAVVKDIEITTSAEHVNLYGWGSIRRQAVAKHSAKIAVKIGYMKFDPVISTGFQFLAWSTGGTNGTIFDTNTVTTYTVLAQFTFEPTATVVTDQHLHASITNVYFPNFPLKMSEGQWMKVDMTGEGSDIVFTNTL